MTLSVDDDIPHCPMCNNTQQVPEHQGVPAGSCPACGPWIAAIVRLKSEIKERVSAHRFMAKLAGDAKCERDSLQRFKDFVHRRLDTAGVQTHPEGPHSAEGCRIGDRLDIVIGERDALLRAAMELRAAQRTYLADRGNDTKGRLVGEAAARLDEVIEAQRARRPE